MSDALSEDEAAACAHVSVETIRKWVQRGHLTPVHDRNGRRVYLEADVLRAESATRRRPRLRLLLTKAVRLSDNEGKPTHP